MKDINGVRHASQKTDQKTSDLASKLAELTADLQRTRADFENFRKQTELQKTQYGESVRFATISKFLPVLDDLERAISAYPELKPLEKTFDKTIADLKLRKIDSRTGVEFNHDLHEAISFEETGDGSRELVAETLRPGYILDGETLRPALVKVQK
jgi:molecular chaperone GrpE